MQYYFDGDSNLYGYTGMDFTTPTKTKQMGSIENHVKIYMEDYVYTYLYQYGRSGGGKEKLAVLIGRHYVVDGQDTLIISGAIQGKATVQQNGVECFSEETWEYIGGQMQTYFKGMTIVGWVHCQPGFGAFLMARDETFHREYFKERWHVLFVLDTMDKLDTFYIYNEEGNGLRQARGYFVYYDRNREMQEYMLENSMVRPKEMEKEERVEEKETAFSEEMEEKDGGRRTRKPTPEERMDAAKEIRRVLQKREKQVKQAKREHYTMLAVVSAVLCIACVCMGLAMMQSLDRLRTLETELVAMQTSYETLAEDFENRKVQTVFAVQDVEKEDKVEEQTENIQKYLVESGDSLRYISRKFYGDNNGVAWIMEANGLMDADMIYEGQVLYIPER